MARRQTRREPEPQPPSIPPSKGIELLKRQIDAGQKLQGDAVIDRNAYDSWISTTVAYVAKAFGEGSNYVTEFKYTGDLVSSPMNAGEAWWDEHRKRALVANWPASNRSLRS